MPTPTAKTRSPRRNPPAPRLPPLLLTDAQAAELLEMQQKLGASLEQATRVIDTQNRQIQNLIEMVDTARTLQRRFAAHMLGVAAGASAAELRWAYRAKAKACHPDAGGDAEGFDLLQRALELLEQPAG